MLPELSSYPESDQMSHLPLNIDVGEMTVLVAGGGTVAFRKIKALLEAGASVRVVAPEIIPEIRQLEDSRAIMVKDGYYQASYLNGVFLAVAATSDQQTNQIIAADARQRGILVNVTDSAEAGNCTFPALLRRGDLEISISTNGKCPGFAAELRDILAADIGEEYGKILETLYMEREKLLTEGRSSTYNKQVLRSRARELINELNTHKERVS
jgi:precorrin-2 dehydrogenase/sirohydrochlorin ferrochelatase